MHEKQHLYTNTSVIFMSVDKGLKSLQLRNTGCNKCHRKRVSIMITTLLSKLMFEIVSLYT